MILRVYAMWNQSKRILYTLLLIYLPPVTVSFVAAGIYSNGNTYLSGMSQAKQAKLKFDYVVSWLLPLAPLSPVTVVQITIDVAFCNISYGSSNSSLQLVQWGVTALRIVLGFMLLILAVISTLKESVAMYKATKQWRPNRYMQLFAKDGILYFFAYVSQFPFLLVPLIFPPILLSSTYKKLTTLNF